MSQEAVPLFKTRKRKSQTMQVREILRRPTQLLEAVHHPKRLRTHLTASDEERGHAITIPASARQGRMEAMHLRMHQDGARHSHHALEKLDPPIVKPKTAVWFEVNGVPLGSPPGQGQNKLSGIAYFHTRSDRRANRYTKEAPKLPRLNKRELEQLLVTLGVPDWRKGFDEVVLPNGTRLAGKLVEMEEA
jgi:hypothetical protein